MTPDWTDRQIVEALENCASEPVHIPGCIQPFGCLMAIGAHCGNITYVSGNVKEFLGADTQEMLGRPAIDYLHPDAWHAVRNAASLTEFSQLPVPLGRFPFAGVQRELSAFGSGDQYVIEIEPTTESDVARLENWRGIDLLSSQLEACYDLESLAETTAELAQAITGYDRVMVYRFDRDFNGTVIAETRKPSMETLLGLRFPSWDIPPQARKIMETLPIRVISDIEAQPVPLLSTPGLPPLDITPAMCRGVSKVHMKYLANMGIRATMTLSIMVEDRLWGMISFHHRRPIYPTMQMRVLLKNRQPIIGARLLALQQSATLRKIRQLDEALLRRLAVGPDQQPSDKTEREAAPLAIAQTLIDAMNAQGIAILGSPDRFRHGQFPSQPVLDRLNELAGDRYEPVNIECLKDWLPDLQDGLNGCAGALICPLSTGRKICVFRQSRTEQIVWAGKPDKAIEVVSGGFQLQPRASFARFLADAEGHCEPWSEEDVNLLHHIRSLLHTAERQSDLERENRQQRLTINELDHRIRNIVTMIRSVTRTELAGSDSTEGFAEVFESRLDSLLQTQDFAVSEPGSPMSVHRLLQMELAAFADAGQAQFVVTGIDRMVQTHVLPILSMMLHEMFTNAVKHGALAVSSGRVAVELVNSDDGLHLTWRESGGSPISLPVTSGSGTRTIRQSAAELGATARLTFEPEGLTAEITLPNSAFLPSPAAADPVDTAAPRSRPPKTETARDAHADGPARHGLAFVIEDNLFIARNIAAMMRDYGFADVKTFDNPEDAMAALSFERPEVAILDVNVGADQSTEPLAVHLLEMGVPFFFVSGYTEIVSLDQRLAKLPKLAKPLERENIHKLLADMLSQG